MTSKLKTIAKMGTLSICLGVGVLLLAGSANAAMYGNNHNYNNYNNGYNNYNNGYNNSNYNNHSNYNNGYNNNYSIQNYPTYPNPNYVNYQTFLQYESRRY